MHFIRLPTTINKKESQNTDYDKTIYDGTKEINSIDEKTSKNMNTEITPPAAPVVVPAIPPSIPAPAPVPPVVVPAVIRPKPYTPPKAQPPAHNVDMSIFGDDDGTTDDILSSITKNKNNNYGNSTATATAAAAADVPNVAKLSVFDDEPRMSDRETAAPVTASDASLQSVDVPEIDDGMKVNQSVSVSAENAQQEITEEESI